jgi:hypothetical protein
MIQNEAEFERAKLLADADAEAIRIQGEADAAAAGSLAVFKEEPELGLLLLKRQALLDVLKDRATLILDSQTPPFDLLKGGPPAGTR